MKKSTLVKALEKGICILVMLVVLIPFIWMVCMAFKTDAEIMSFPPTFFPKEITLKHMTSIWKRIPLMIYIKNTVIFSIGVAFVSVMIDSLAGYAFARIRFKGRDVLFSLILMTMMVPFQVTMIPLYIETYKFGLLNTFVGLILPRAKDLEEAARIDGLNEFGIYMRIMLPLCKSAFITLFIFVLMGNWNDLLYPMMMTSSTNMRTLPAGLAMFVGEGLTEVGPSMAGAFISMLPLFILYCFAQKYFVQGIAVSGMKG